MSDDPSSAQASRETFAAELWDEYGWGLTGRDLIGLLAAVAVFAAVLTLWH
jgi:hypothetical protein